MVRDANKLLLRMQARIVKHAWKEMAYSNFRTEKGKRKSREREIRKDYAQTMNSISVLLFTKKKTNNVNTISYTGTHIYTYIYIYRHINGVLRLHQKLLECVV